MCCPYRISCIQHLWGSMASLTPIFAGYHPNIRVWECLNVNPASVGKGVMPWWQKTANCVQWDRYSTLTHNTLPPHPTTMCL